MWTAVICSLSPFLKGQFVHAIAVAPVTRLCRKTPSTCKGAPQHIHAQPLASLVKCPKARSARHDCCYHHSRPSSPQPHLFTQGVWPIVVSVYPAVQHEHAPYIQLLAKPRPLFLYALRSIPIMQHTFYFEQNSSFKCQFMPLYPQLHVFQIDHSTSCWLPLPACATLSS